MSEDISLDDLKLQGSSAADVEYELPSQCPTKEIKQNHPPVLPMNRMKQWSVPIIIILLMQFLLLILFVAVVCIFGFFIIQKDTTSTFDSSHISGLADDIAKIVLEKLINNTPNFPNFTEWSDGVAQNVLVKISDSTPNFTEWSDGVAQNVLEKLNNNTPNFPNFTEWSDGVAQNVLVKISDSTPNFTEWSNGVAQVVYYNISAILNDSTMSNQLEIMLNTTNFTKDLLLNTSNSSQALLNNITASLGTVIEKIADINGSPGPEIGSGRSDNLIRPTSCQDVEANGLSGVYMLQDPITHATYTAYCNMDDLCGSEGGWMRIAYLNMSDSTQSCPSGFRLYHSGNVRACGRPVTNSGSCASVQFPYKGISYSQVCGRIVGYQYASPDASSHDDLNDAYVDGVSITRGSPRKHVWTLTAGNSGISTCNVCNCPCSNESLQQVQSFIGSHYFCESGNPLSHWSYNTLYTADPLWDGEGCGPIETVCCSAPGLPWFHRDYGNAVTKDYLELRVCGDEGTRNEDVPIAYYEIYVK